MVSMTSDIVHNPSYDMLFQEELDPNSKATNVAY